MVKHLILCLASIIFLAGPSAHGADLSDEEFAVKMQAYLNDDANLEKLYSAIERKMVLINRRDAKLAREAEEKRIEAHFKNPVEIELGESPSMGPDHAKVTIVAFSNFQCPYCMRGANIIRSVLEEYPNDVRLVYKHLPLEFHPQAEPAARASIAADRQGKFWEMHDLLFGNQRDLSDETYVRLAGDLGLDVKKFNADYVNSKIVELVKQDKVLAGQLGIRSTPVFFINGVQLNGAQPKERFKTIIDRWLK